LGKPSFYGFSNPFAIELALDYETPSPILLRKWPCFAQESLEKFGVALGLQAGMCCEKASASGLASLLSTTDSAFAQ
jgi:hypothetical protein